MFIMACFSYTQNKILFAVEITVSGLCLAAVIMTDLHYRVHVYTALRAARKVLSADEQRNLGQFALPLAVLGSAGDIVWTNERFQDLFTENGEGCGDNIAAYIYPKTLRQIPHHVRGGIRPAQLGDRHHGGLSAPHDERALYAHHGRPAH